MWAKSAPMCEFKRGSSRTHTDTNAVKVQIRRSLAGRANASNRRRLDSGTSAQASSARHDDAANTGRS